MDELKAAVAELSEKAARLGALEGALDRNSTELKGLGARLSRLEAARNRPGAPGAGRFERTESDEHGAAFKSWLKNPRSDSRTRALAELEAKTASGVTDPAGGHIVPEVIARPLLERARDRNPLATLVRRIEVASGDVVLPLANADSTTGWAGETAVRNATPEGTLSGPKPTFGTLFALVSASEELVQDAVFDVANWFTIEAAGAMAEAEMNAIISGDGSSKPTGLLATAPEAGADGSRTAGALKYIPSGAADDLGTDPLDVMIGAYYDLKADYRANATWVMNSATASVIRQARTTDGLYLWADPGAVGTPPTFMGRPVVLAEGMEDIGTNAHPIFFGDLDRAYVVAERGGLRVTLDDNISSPGSVRWYLRRRLGGITYDENALRAIKCATS